MATLFFEGFEKGVIFNELDRNYWSSQFKQFPKYAFGGYLPLYDGSNNTYLQYTYNSPNGGILPSGSYIGSIYNIGKITDPNSYPQFGSPPGFLAFTNIEVEDSITLEYPTYLQASGFSIPSGDITYLSMRCLGLESKHTDYSTYPYRHKLFSYNSGNTPMLTVNIVKISGNNQFIPINTKYETLALEIEQNNNIIGYFDLNISNSINNYRIAHVYSTDNKILTIADTVSYYGWASVCSRWAHLEFSIDESDNNAPAMLINAEDINLPVINNNSEINREDWEISLPISGFKFDNLRFYNRTYSSSIKNSISSNGYGGVINQNTASNYYYMMGKVWLLDDLVLIDNSGSDPSYWLGSTARVVQMIPGSPSTTYVYPIGYTNSLTLQDNAGRKDGIKDWSTNSTITYQSSTDPYPMVSEQSHRKALSFLDNDTNSIQTINSGSIDAVAMNTRPANGDSLSVWRESLNEAIGGIKIYNSARKKYLDTKFVNVFRSGISDYYEDSVSLLLHGDSLPIVDSARIPKTITPNNASVYGGNYKFGEGSLFFPSSNSYLSVTHSDLAQNEFTIECWIYFSNNSQIISLFDKKPLLFDQYCGSSYYSLLVNTSGVIFQRGNNCDKILLFNQPIQTGTWNHVAVVRTSGSDLRSYLNGSGNTSYKIYNCENRPCPAELSSYNYNLNLEPQGTYNGTYSLNFLNDKNIVSNLNTVRLGSVSIIDEFDSSFNNVSLLLKADHGIIDLSNNTKNITNSGVATSFTRSRFDDRSFYFTGGKTLTFDNSNDFDFGTNDFTIDFWFLITDTTPSQSYTILDGQIKCYIYTGTGGDPSMPNIRFDITKNGVTYSFYNSGFPLDANSYNNGRRSWYYVSLVRFRGEFFAYVVPQGSTLTPGYYGYGASWPPRIMQGDPFTVPNLDFAVDLRNFTLGDSNSALSHKLYIDNFRITKGISRITTRLLSPITAPSKPFGSLLDPMSNPGAYIDDYRITYGICRYNNNFAPPTGALKHERDDYYPVSPTYTVNKTTYKTFQNFAFQNPATNKNWTLPEISGMILGVKKV